MGLDIEDVLKIDIEKYFKVTGEKPEEYKLKGVNVNGYSSQMHSTPDEIINKFAERVPAEAVKVVDYEVVLQKDCYFVASGIALVPKPEDDKWTDNKGLSRTDMES